MDFDKPFPGSTAVSAGLVTRDRLYGPHFRRVFPDVYVSAAVEVDLLLPTPVGLGADCCPARPRDR
jgi:hypothetical protein